MSNSVRFFALRLAQYDRVALVRHRFRRPCGVSRTLQLRRHRFSMAPSKISTSRAMGDVHGEEERNPRSRVVRLCRHFGNRCRAQELCPGARQGDGGRRASGAGSPETGEEKTSSAQAKGEGCEEEADQEDGVQKETSLIPPEALTSFPFASCNHVVTTARTHIACGRSSRAGSLSLRSAAARRRFRLCRPRKIVRNRKVDLFLAAACALRKSAAERLAFHRPPINGGAAIASSASRDRAQRTSARARRSGAAETPH